MKRLRSSVAAACLAAAAGCADHGPVTGPIAGLPRELTPSETQLVSRGNDFAFALFRAVAAQSGPDSNLFLSPLSVGMALGMTYNGAAGTTQAAMQGVLGLDGMSLGEVNRSYRGVIDLLRGLDPRVDFTLANSIWYRQGVTFEQAFLDTCATYFDAAVRGLDFSSSGAAPTINAWVSAQTGGRIPTIVPDVIPTDVVMYLINAVYFKGAWVTQFDPSRTAPGTFTRFDGAGVSVPMMRYASEAPVRTGGDAAVQVLDLRYGGGAYSMTIVMPRDAGGMDSLLAGLTRQRWDGWIAGLDSGTSQVVLPKFTMRYALRMNDVLTALGMGVAFVPCPGTPDCADFTRMRPERDLFISEVMHKTFVDVNEEGTEAAAATSVGIGITAARPPIAIDRPFLFAIRERFSGTILFIGRMMDPATP
ncbi:MAG TPA: serpin family protein [Gemmatimonadales bacterium]|nr:serpin family protein [Gemmatimonadales bacterium]